LTFQKFISDHDVFKFHSAMPIHTGEPPLLRAERIPVVKSVPDEAPRISNNNPLPTRKLATLPDPTRSLVDTGTIRLEWNKNAMEVQLLPMYFPKNNLNYEFPAEQLDGVMDRISELLRESSIQAKLRDNPLSAFLQTCENIEFYLVFFFEKPDRRKPNSMDPKKRKTYLSVQRHKGDQMIANRYIQGIVDAAKGVSTADAGRSTRSLPMHRSTPNAEALLQVERMVVRSCELSEDPATRDINTPASFVNYSPQDMIKSSVTQMYSWIQHPKRLDNRQHVLEYLVVMTSLDRTMSSSAIGGALLVLQGSAPDMNDEAKEIQQFFLTILQHRALPGDRSMFDGMNLSATDPDKDIELTPYFPEESDAAQGYPPFFVDYMNKLFHLALQVLAQSLEVVATFHKQIVNDGNNIHDMASDFLYDASEMADGKELYTTLLECVSRAESKLANAYLACKAFRLLALAYPSLKERLKMDDVARASIQNAYNVGKSCHSLLKDESFQLWETVRQ
jgi:hypothetical protein